MTNKGRVALAVVTLGVAAYATREYWDPRPVSAPLPTWIRGEFAASAERYAGRTVTVDSSMIKFGRGADGADVLPIEWIEEVKDARRNIRVFDLHVTDATVKSTIRLVASAEDSSFRLQTMQDVAWRHLSEYDARAARTLARESAHPDSGATAPAAVAVAVKPTPARATASDTVIGATRFADRDPVSRDELSRVVAACRRYGCRIGIRGLQASRFEEFSTYLRGLGADSVSLSAEPTMTTTLAMLEITPRHKASVR